MDQQNFGEESDQCVANEITYQVSIGFNGKSSGFPFCNTRLRQKRKLR